MKNGRKPEASLPEEDDPAQSKERPQTGKLDKNMIRIICDEIVSITDILDFHLAGTMKMSSNCCLKLHLYLCYNLGKFSPVYPRGVL